MKRVVSISLLRALLPVSVLLISCKKDDANAGNQSTNSGPQGILSLYAGSWTGSIIVDDLNPSVCYFSDDPLTVNQKWIVRPDSTLTINETTRGASVSNQVWTGRLYNGDSLSAILTRDVTCFGVSQYMMALLKTTIVKETDNKYTIRTKVYYPMCPPDCLFSFNYLLKKE